jgi:hypothetical protein
MLIGYVRVSNSDGAKTLAPQRDVCSVAWSRLICVAPARSSSKNPFAVAVGIAPAPKNPELPVSPIPLA